MKIYGFQKLTLLDYPEHIAATVFTGACNFRCPFCHNGELVLIEKDAPTISEEEIFAHLNKRKGMLQGVCITGGEPTLQPDLEEFIRKVKDLGYLVKLDTNGYRPDELKTLLDKGLLDYVAMDIKAAPSNYGMAAGVSGIDMSPILESVNILKKSAIPYEFRTTVVKGIHTPEEFEEIGKLIEGASSYHIQSYKESENNLAPGPYSSYTKEALESMAKIVEKYVDKVSLRGVE